MNNRASFKYLIIFLLASLQIYGQATGYKDTFEGPQKATAPPSFKLTQANGTLHVDINKQASVTWQGVDYPIGEAIDLTSNPIVNFQMKSDKPVQLTVYIFDALYVNDTRNIKIYPSNEYVKYSIDFSEYRPSMDISQIVSLKFTPNGNSISEFNANMYFDEISIGTEAMKIAGIGAIKEVSVFRNSSENMMNLLDLENTQSMEVTGGNDAVTNLFISTIRNDYAGLSFDAMENFVGIDTIYIKAIPIEGYVPNTIKVPVIVEDNKPPYLDTVPIQNVMVGDTLQIHLEGISDGNFTTTQSLILSAESDNQSALPNGNISIEYTYGSSIARLTYSCLETAENITVTITVDDLYEYNNIYTTQFTINAYQQINNPPTLAKVENQYVYLEDEKDSLLLTNISDGDDGLQTLSFEISSSDTNIISNSELSLKHQNSESSAIVEYNPKSIGVTTISIIVRDNGGTENNNGDASTEVQFVLEVGNKPLKGHSADFTNFDNWGLNYADGQQDYELGTFHERENVLKISINDKTCWTGTMYLTPELDVNEHPYLSYDIYFEGESFAIAGVGGATHCYMYDDGWDADENRNLPATHEQRKRVYSDMWSTVVMDFRAENGMDNNNGGTIDATRIQKVLLNYASNFTWPFPIDNGVVYIANLNIGDEVPKELLPIKIPKCTIFPIPNQTVFINTSKKTIELTNITDGSDKSVIPSLIATSSDTAFIPHPTISEVNEDGEAELSFVPFNKVGETMITLTVSAEGSQDRVTFFRVSVVDRDISQTVDIDLYPDSTYQTMRGFGTFQFSGESHYSSFYTEDLGASAVRIGIISNQIETVNDNNDPYSLNMSAFDYSAFDWDYYKKLKENNVETFILTSWSPPAWMKRNLSVDYGYAAAPEYELTDNVLEPYYDQEFAESMVAVIKMFKEKCDIDLYAIGIQNEPAFCEPYASAILSPERFAELVAIVGERFELEGISTKLYMPEQVFSQSHYSMTDYINALISSTDAEKYTDIIATHAYGEDGIKSGQPSYLGWVDLWNKSQQCLNPKELWMSETYPECNSFEDAFSLAGAIHGALKFGNVSLWTLWNIEGALLKLSKPLQSFYTSKNYYKYIRPGAKRVRADSKHEDVMVTSFIDDHNMMLTTVLINKNSNPITVRILGRVDSIPAKYDIFTTAKNINFEKFGEVGVNETLALPGMSVTTLVGKTDGDMVVKAAVTILPDDYKLQQNYPNPFNPSTTIRYSLKKPGEVKIVIYDILGRRVQNLVDKVQQAGRYEVKFNASHLATGVYFYRIIANDFIDVKKMMLLK